jgi:predicted small lipoprotein YifL
MKNFKKITAMMLAVLMMFSLVACGEKKTDEPAKTPDATVSDVVEDTTPSDSETEQAPNETADEFADEQLGEDAAVFMEKLGRNFGEVSVGDNFGGYFDEENIYGEMFFDDEDKGNAVVARMMRVTSETEVTDVFVNIVLDWSKATDEVVYGDVTAKVLRDTIDEGELIAACWIDEDAGLVYGIAVIGETLEIENYISEIFYPEA